MSYKMLESRTIYGVGCDFSFNNLPHAKRSQLPDSAFEEGNAAIYTEVSLLLSLDKVEPPHAVQRSCHTRQPYCWVCGVRDNRGSV